MAGKNLRKDPNREWEITNRKKRKEKHQEIK
jgi:hypothetical protein